MIPKVARNKSALICKIPQIERRWRLPPDHLPDMLWNTRSGVCLNNWLEVVLPYSIFASIAFCCPVASPILEVNNRYTIFFDSPCDVCDHLLNERKEAYISFTDYMEHFRFGRIDVCTFCA
jgi:hypothetical protein